MPKLLQKEEGASIVLIGAFNAAIFQPSWFALQNLIRREEAEAARIEVVTNEISSFETDWFKLIVTNDRFSVVTTQQSAYDLMRDLVVGAFAVLHHTPLTSMGLNLEAHFACETDAQWHAIGDTLAPKDAWRATFDSHVGMRSLQMQVEPNPGQHGRLLVRVEPSLKFPPGVWMSVNDHYEKEVSHEAPGAISLVKLLEATWSGSIEYARASMVKLQEKLT
jgi:hypothetical protein